MSWTAVFSFLNNATVGGFFGALFAFLFLVAWDRRKDRKLVQQIANEIDRAQFHTAGTLESARRNLAAIRENDLVYGADLLKVDTGVVKRLLSEAWHLLKPEQQRAVDAIVHRVEGADRLLDDVYRFTDELRRTAYEDPTRIERMDQRVTAYRDAIRNLRIAIEMAEHYAGGRASVITTKAYRPSDYDDPPTASST